MSTQSISTQSPDRDRIRESAARRIRVARRSAAALASGQGHAATPQATSPGSSDTTRSASGVGGARILRRWSVADLIARAGGAPRAFA
jgi:hypothetical protein